MKDNYVLFISYFFLDVVINIIIISIFQYHIIFYIYIIQFSYILKYKIHYISWYYIIYLFERLFI